MNLTFFIFRETPLISPEHVQSAACPAEHECHDLGSTLFHHLPYCTVTMLQNAPPALMNHPPVPLNQFPANTLEFH
ncbi:hypothetical protein PAXRUDRAFT_163278 [Paxillus rubicundulus Ve08.2h10]|uniref:Uncharacterized protein n=1 Tax=Paxillus rubicundulus Ve08.2h10 TaxID=930991 RepID=A0A0D0CTF5_9AGAM|nr:hypothetical protein PAXRUDRAFT_163278 [Paxillus rubicundulus Ve08.2h10]